MTDKAPERIWASYPEGWFSAFGNNKLSAYVRADIHNAVVAERDAALNKAESLGWAVDALKQSVDHAMERRAGEFKAERDEARGDTAVSHAARYKAEAERDEALNQLSSMTHAVQTLERHGEKVKAEREKLKAEVEAWRDRFQYCGFDGTSIVMSG